MQRFQIYVQKDEMKEEIQAAIERKLRDSGRWTAL